MNSSSITTNMVSSLLTNNNQHLLTSTSSTILSTSFNQLQHKLLLPHHLPAIIATTATARRRRPLLYCAAEGATITATAADSKSSSSSSGGFYSEHLDEIYSNCSTWVWKGKYNINYYSSSSGTTEKGTPILLVHGFGASIGHWRRNIGVLNENGYSVFALDLLGFGASDKPAGFLYQMEVWEELIVDFLREVVQKPTVLVGNSVGSLACIIAAAGESSEGLVRGLVLLNCAGGMNNKAIVDDWRIRILLPLFWLIDFLLKIKPIASALFGRVKRRETLKNILMSVYGNKESVDDELVDIIRGPADEEGALDAFVSVVTGPPGPNPISLLPNISMPILVLWGDQDPFTPIDGPVGKYFSSLPSEFPNVQLYMLEGVGHCPHDDRPELVHNRLLPWLTSLSPL